MLFRLFLTMGNQKSVDADDNLMKNLMQIKLAIMQNACRITFWQKQLISDCNTACFSGTQCIHEGIFPKDGIASVRMLSVLSHFSQILIE